jgi:biotin operon repressor
VLIKSTVSSARSTLENRVRRALQSDDPPSLSELARELGVRRAVVGHVARALRERGALLTQTRRPRRP